MTTHARGTATLSSSGAGVRGMTAVRHALRSDLDGLARSLADAFWDDPLVAWLYPDAESRQAQGEQFMRTALDIGLPHGHVYAAGADAGVAIWSPPDVEMFDDAAIGTLFSLLGVQLGDRAGEIAAGMLAINEHHPHGEPHFYLFMLGTERAHQGTGVGSTLLRHVLDRCDEQGMGAYLESTNIRNVPFYERHGFRVITEVDVSPDFCARPMWRDPQTLRVG